MTEARLKQTERIIKNTRIIKQCMADSVSVSDELLEEQCELLETRQEEEIKEEESLLIIKEWALTFEVCILCKVRKPCELFVLFGNSNQIAQWVCLGCFNEIK